MSNSVILLEKSLKLSSKILVCFIGFIVLYIVFPCLIFPLSSLFSTGGDPKKMMEFIVKNPSMITLDFAEVRFFFLSTFYILFHNSQKN